MIQLNVKKQIVFANSRAKRGTRFVRDECLPEGPRKGVCFSDERAGTRQ